MVDIKPLFPEPTINTARFWRHKTVGLLGGSFNPVHEGHLHISQQALRKLPIDCLWWNFTPKNPFKKNIETPSIDERIAQARSIVDNPRIIFSRIEKELNIYRTHQLGAALHHYYPQTNFIWIGGIDLVDGFHRWENWQEIPSYFPIVFFQRPPFKGSIKRSVLRANKTLHHEFKLPHLPSDYKKSHIYWDLHGKTCIASSSALREAQQR